ncbi:MAG TPA: outer membrane beta-barrel protein [Granulicella sp.]|jgi:outer membrane immunogenic protein|nr:outer membrane beta-barrel protein [Granulicella sp.]
MKKTMLMGALLLSAITAFGQESRQDVSISATGGFIPTVHGATGTYTTTNASLGALVSYRYLLTPRSGLEVNYGFTQNTPVYTIPGTQQNQIHARNQEISAAYVFNRTYKRYNPFVEAGPGVMFYSPIHDFQSNILDTTRTTTIGGIFGAGVAYELSPSFDLRAEYRGFLGKTPNFGITNFSTNRYRVNSEVAIGVAYHF